LLAGSGRCLCRGDEGLAGVVGVVLGLRLLARGVGDIGGFRLLVMVVAGVVGFSVVRLGVEVIGVVGDLLSAGTTLTYPTISINA